MPGQRILIIAILFVLIQTTSVAGQTTPTTKIYRGRLGDQHIQMELTRDGDITTGRYFYDQFQKDLRLEGRNDKDRRLELRETDATGRHTGTFVCKREDERGPIDMDLECDWSKPNGSGQLTAWLTEQSIDARPMRLAPTKRPLAPSSGARSVRAWVALPRSNATR